MPLEMRGACEKCSRSLAVDAPAYICSYECTFCPGCAERDASGVSELQG